MMRTMVLGKLQPGDRAAEHLSHCCGNFFGFLHLLYFPAVSTGQAHVNAAVEVAFTLWNSLKKAEIQISPFCSSTVSH